MTIWRKVLNRGWADVAPMRGLNLLFRPIPGLTSLAIVGRPCRGWCFGNAFVMTFADSLAGAPAPHVLDDQQGTDLKHFLIETFASHPCRRVRDKNGAPLSVS